MHAFTWKITRQMLKKFLTVVAEWGYEMDGSFTKFIIFF